MEKAILFAAIIMVLYVVLKVLEGKYLDNEPRPLKLLVRDAVIVFITSLSVLYVSMHYDSQVQEMLSFLTGNVKTVTEKAMIFTGDPEF